MPQADSGIYLRGCPQVQIWDSTGKGTSSALAPTRARAGLWNNSPGAPGKDPLVKADKPFGQWNHFRIIMVGSRVWVWLNGKLTVKDAADGELLRPQAAGAAQEARSSCRRTAAKFAGATSSFARSEATRRTGSFAARTRRVQTRFQRQKPERLGRAAGLLRGRPTAPSSGVTHKGGTIYTKQDYDEFRGAAGIQAAAGRQQWPGHPLSRQRRHGLRGACANARYSTTITRRPPGRRLTRGRRTARPTAWSRRCAVTSIPSATGTIEEVTVKGHDDQSRTEWHRDPRPRPLQRDRVHARFAASRQGRAPAATSVSPATTTRSPSGTSRSSRSERRSGAAWFGLVRRDRFPRRSYGKLQQR